MSEITLFDERFSQYEDQIKNLYEQVYPAHAFEGLVQTMRKAYDKRKSALKKMDLTHQDWHLDTSVVGMTLYVDLFSKNLDGFKKKIPYLKELGITFIHFMPILKPREGENDGGYAVKDYKALNEDLGSMSEFRDLLTLMRKNGIYCAVDFVVNHTSKEHEWAQKALAGDPVYQNYYFMYDTDETPREFDKTVPEVFPGVAPGNFTYYDAINKWVFTSFYEFQWDLNFTNPKVFEEIVDIMLYLGNVGVNMIRLDAIPFMWKTIGTKCRNLPQIHILLEMFTLIIKAVAPSVVLLGEAIVEPEEIVKYYGTHNQECQALYNATLMVNLWNAVATRDARLIAIDQSRFHLPKWACWINYIRCHDDIGWGFNEEAIKQIGMSPYDHKQFLIRFYEGTFNGSFSKGQLYEYHEETGDARNSGTFASLCGLEQAQAAHDDYLRELAIKRMQMIDSFLMASAGIPLIYSGDEIATMNDYSYMEDEHKGHDSRWLHRPKFDWERAQLRDDLGTSEGQVFQKLKALIAARKDLDILGNHTPTHFVHLNTNHVSCFVKEWEGHTFVGLFNFSEDRQFVGLEPFKMMGLFHQELTDVLSGRKLDFDDDNILIGPYGFHWFYK